MRRLTYGLLLVLAMALTSFATPIGLGFYTYNDLTGDPIPLMYNGTAVPVNNLIQVIKIGANGTMDVPNADGSVAGDDTLSTTTMIGGGLDPMEPGLLAVTLTGFSVASERLNSSTLYNGIVFYFRVWVHPTQVVAGLPIPAGAAYATYGPYTCPSGDTDFWNVNANPSSAAPLWTSTGPAPAPTAEVSFNSVAVLSGSLELFGSVSVGATSGKTYTLHNGGNATLNYGAGAVTGDFATTLAAGTLVAGADVSFNISFSPTATGTRNGTFSFTHDAAGSPYMLNLEGTGSENPWTPGTPFDPGPNPNPPGTPWTPTIPTDPSTGGFAPLGLFFGAAGTNPGNVFISYNDTPPVGQIFPPSNTIDRFWNISESGGAGFTCTVEFLFTDNELPIGFGDPRFADPALRVGRFHEVTGQLLALYTPVITLEAAGAPNVWKATITGVSGFSLWGIGNGGILPVTGLAMSANAGNGRVTLAWSVETEVNNGYFQVERRVVDGEWNVISRVNSRAPSGNSSSLVRYAYEDNNLTNGTTYEYRVVDVSLDGVASYSNLVVSATPVAPVIAEYALSNYPNPFNPETRINYTVKDAGVVTLTVTNIMGQSVATLVNEHKDAGTHAVTWNAGSLPSGIYFLRYDVNGFHGMSKMVLSK